MSDGQHIGRLSDSLSGEEGSARDAQRRALEALKRPVQQRRGPRYEVGDGDPCPLVPEHGKMLLIRNRPTQYCPHQSHDTKTRATWPRQFLAAAVATYTGSSAGPAATTLPDLDIEV